MFVRRCQRPPKDERKEYMREESHRKMVAGREVAPLNSACRRSGLQMQVPPDRIARKPQTGVGIGQSVHPCAMIVLRSIPTSTRVLLLLTFTVEAPRPMFSVGRVAPSPL